MYNQFSNGSRSLGHPGVSIFAAFAGFVLALPLVVGIAGLLFLGT